MARLYFLIAAATFIAVAFAEPEPNDFQILKGIHQIFPSFSPGVKLESVEDTESGKKYHYTIGIRKAGDRKIDYNSKSIVNSIPKDYDIRLEQPVGPDYITYVDITVEQSSDYSKAYLVTGGIGQRSISIDVEAKKTTYLSIKADFYGLSLK